MKKILSALALTILLGACSSRPGPMRVDQGTPEWDYNQVRSVRQAEGEQQRADQQRADQEMNAPAKVLSSEINDDSKCRILPKAEMLKEKVTGCRLMEGRGDDTFCCPK